MPLPILHPSIPSQSSPFYTGNHPPSQHITNREQLNIGSKQNHAIFPTTDRLVTIKQLSEYPSWCTQMLGQSFPAPPPHLFPIPFHHPTMLCCILIKPSVHCSTLFLRSCILSTSIPPSPLLSQSTAPCQLMSYSMSSNDVLGTPADVFIHW